ncbi:Spy0128 family protein [Helcococcus massiliensis]|uniref:Spy0128 family protein n=1 Tax=Helcococcus massiliensis TaxID=2040290 RepID=UPI000CDEE2AE|nr:FctA domain-containing protein [Helcococcus massiliensis]
MKRRTRIVSLFLAFIMVLSNISYPATALANSLNGDQEIIEIDNTQTENKSESKDDKDELSKEDIKNLDKLKEHISRDSNDAIELNEELGLKAADKISTDQYNKIMSRSSLNARNVSLFNARNASNDAADGSKIESISVSWIDKDQQDNSRLNLVWTDNYNQSVRMKLNFAMSGQYDYEPGKVQIKIPKHIFKDRNGEPIGNMTLAVPKAPDNNGIFNYVETDDSYILVNTKTISAASQGSIEMTINSLKPSEIKDLKSGYVTDPFYADISIITNKGNQITKISNKIDVQVDTKARIYDAFKRNETFVHESYPSDWPQELKPKENADDYVFVKWTAGANTKASQYFYVEVEDKADNTKEYNKGVKVLGFEDSKQGKVYKNETGEASVFKETIAKNVYYNDGQNFNSTIYTAYPKSEFENGKTYELKNNINFKMTAVDDGETSETSANASIKYSPVAYHKPTGHFIVRKRGMGPQNTMVSGKREGIYSTALNDLSNGKNTDIEFEVDVVGFGEKWTLGEDSQGKDLDSFNKKSYNQKDYTLVVEDTDVNFDYGKSLDSKSFEFKSLRFKTPIISDYKKFEETRYGYLEGENGIAWGIIPKGYYGYERIEDKKQIPDIEVFGMVDGNNDYTKFATISHKTGSMVIETVNGAKSDRDKVIFPENIVKYKVTSKTKLSHLEWNMYPTVTLKANNQIKEQVQNLYDNSLRPMTRSENTIKMDILVNNSKDLKHINVDIGRDQLMGFSSGTKMDKHLSYSNDKSNGRVLLNYSAKVRTETNVNSLEALQDAIDSGLYEEQKKGIFYDLLPEGVIPDTKTIKLRENDTITNIELFENYKNTGRILLKVEADLTPNYKLNNKASDTIIGAPGYYDEQEISFQARYSWLSLKDFGEKLDNKIAYEAVGIDKLGSIKDLMGEPDNPYAGNNKYTKDAFSDEDKEIKDAFVNLNDNHDKPVFVYAKNESSVEADTYTLASLQKLVDVNNEQSYGDGLDNLLPKNVYEGGQYSYNIRYRTTQTTKSKNIVIYDNLENYKPTSDKEDHNDQTWIGQFRSIDVRALRNRGVDVKVYYSVKENLTLDDTDNRQDMDLSNTNIWSIQEPSDKSKITAIAVDARKDTEGNDFVLNELEEISLIINMSAPMVKDLAKAGEESKWYDTDLKENETEEGLNGGAHAYNNISMLASTASKGDSSQKVELIRQDYVKVGLKPHNIEVTKEWDDFNDRDGKRTDSVTIRLLANGVYTEKSLVLSNDNEWKGVFENLPYQDKDGNKIIYSLKEDYVEGYNFIPGPGEDIKNGIKYNTKNKHNPELVVIEGEKKWDDRNEITRPESIEIMLYKNGVRYITKTVRPDSNGQWKFKFDNLFKYENGEEITYTIKEKYVNGYVSDIKDFNITNKYTPYGNLNISKEITNKLESNKDQNFTFEFFLRKPDGEIFNSRFKFVKYNKETEEEISEETVSSNGGLIEFNSNEKVVIEKVNSDYQYELVETNIPQGYKFDNRNSENIQGTIQAGEEKSVKAVNIYTSKGELRLDASKTLKGRDLIPGEFLFDIKDKATGNIVSSGRNSSDGKINFAAIEFTYEDIGKEFNYILVERNLGAKGITKYDESQYEFTVDLVDNGDGTISASPRYLDKKLEYSDDNPHFINEYKAEGELELKAWKFIQNNFEIKKDDFTFAIYDEEGKELAQSKNDENGKISFKLKFDETDINKTKTFTIKELAGDNQDMIYDDSSIKYTVRVIDNKDGTLSFESNAKDLKTDDIKNDPSLPIFVNKYKDGSLSIQKEIKGYGDPNKIFKFKVRLKGDKDLLPKGKLDIKRSYVNDQESNVSNFSNDKESSNNIFRNVLDSVINLFTPSTVEAAASDAPYALSKGYITTNHRVVKSGTIDNENGSHGITWEIYDNGHLVIRPTGSDAGVISIGEYEFLAYRHVSENVPWVHEKYDSLSIEKNVKGGRSIGGVFTEEGIPGFGNDSSSDSNRGNKPTHAKRIDVTNLDTSETEIFREMFRGNKELVELIGLETLDTSNMKRMDEMFQRVESLKTLNLSSFKTSKVENFAAIFDNMHSLEELDLSGFDMTNMTGQSSMLSYLHSLKKITLGPKTKLKTEAGLENRNNYNSDANQWININDETQRYTAIELQNLTGDPTGTYRLGGKPYKLRYKMIYKRFSYSPEINLPDAYSNIYNKEEKILEMGDNFVIPKPSHLAKTTVNGKEYYTVKNDGITLGLVNFKLLSYDGATPNRITYYGDYNIGDRINTSRFSSINNPHVYLESTWKRLNYKINFYSTNLGGGEEIEPIIANPGEEIVLPDLVREFTTEDGIKYIFEGYYDYGMFGQYQPGQTFIQNLQDNVELSDVSFYAQWKAINYIISFDTNGGIQTYKDIIAKEDEPVKLPTPTRLGYKFKGWSRYPDGDIISDNKNIFSTGHEGTLYAVWEPDNNNIDIVDGEFEIELIPGQKVTIENLPAGITYEVYEEKEDGWVLVSEENTSGEIKANTESMAKFVNESRPNSIEAKIKGKKYLDGQGTKGFKFNLLNEDREVVDTAVSLEDGSFSFANRIFDDDYYYYQENEFYEETYYIQEVVGQDPSINYDTHEEKVVIRVSRAENGYSLKSEVIYPEGQTETVFNNTTKKNNLTISKEVTGTDAKDIDFTIVVSINGGEGSPNGYDETITLKNGESHTIENLKYGTNYEIKEINLTDNYTLENISNESGVIKGTDVKSVVTNKYSYETSGSFNLKAKKILENAELQSGQFEFELLDKDKNLKEKVRNDQFGEINFNAISLDEPGEYTYYIREIKADLPNIKYDTHEEIVKVTATDNKTGSLDIKVEYDNDGPVFTNIYEPEDNTNIDSYDLKVSKKVVGTERLDKFTLVVSLSDKDRQVLTSAYHWASDTKSGTIKDGGSIKISAGETITIKQLPEGAIVEVVEEESAGYTLSQDSKTTETITDKENVISLTNIYSANGQLEIKANKTLVGKDIKDYEFEFMIMEDDKIIQTARNNDKGEIVFEPIQYTLDDIGTHKYRVLEKAGNENTIKYDDKVYEIEVKVSDGGQGKLITEISGLNEDINFKNVYRPIMPVTGTHNTISYLLALTSMLFVALYINKKDSIRRKIYENKIK